MALSQYERTRRWRKNNKEHLQHYSRRVKYGVTAEQFNELMKAQDSCCAICRKPFEDKSPVVDHNHETKEVRGLLCTACNNGLGLFRDSKRLLAQASEYLEKHGSYFKDE